MKSGFIIALLLLLVCSASLSAKEISTMNSASISFYNPDSLAETADPQSYEWNKLPLKKAGIYTIESSFTLKKLHLDSSLFLYLPPCPYPCEISINGELLYSYGHLENSTTLANYDAETIKIKTKQVHNNLKITFYTDGQILAFPKPWVGNEFVTNREAYKQTLLNHTLINAIVVTGIFTSLLFFAMSAISKFKEKDLLYFSLYVLALSCSYLIFLLNSPESNEMLWFTISRISLLYLITFLAFYITEYTKILNTHSFKLFMLLVSIPFAIMILNATTKNEIHIAYLIAVKWVYRPTLFLILGIFTYSLYAKKNLQVLIPLCGFITMLITALRDAKYLEILAWPDFWVLPYGYVGETVSIIITIAVRQSTLLNNLSEKEKILENTNLQLSDANIQISLESSAKDNFIKTVAHELRTPLTGLLGAVQSLSSKKSLPDDIKIDTDALNTSAFRLKLTMNNIIDYESIKNGRFSLVSHPFHIKRGVQRLINVYKNDAKMKNISLILIYRDNLVPEYLYGDEERIVRILDNLISNAIKFTNSGGASCEIDYQNGNLVIIVSDTGAGISGDLQDRIMSSLSKNSSDTFTKQYEGIGLGLAIVDKTIKAMDGTLEFISTKGQGSRFTATIPMKPAENPTSKGNKELILIAEDNDINRRILSDQLKKLNYTPKTVINGVEAVREAEKGLYKAVLMDVQMPLMNGIDATRNIKFSDLKVPIIGITANADMNECINAGMDDVLFKPVTPEQIHFTIQKYITSYQEKDLLNIEDTIRD